jgi:23S rRNA pseudouridine2605 synthase
VRLQKLLAQAGVASRREAERLISQGRVSVNGAVVTQLGSQAAEDAVIEVDGRRIIGREAYEYYVLNKPVGVLSTVRDPQGRPTVRRLLPEVKTRVYPVGRLDADSEGLLLLTNDGELAHRLTHPRYGVEKEYVVGLSQPPSKQELDRIRQGIQADGQTLRAREIRRTVDGICVVLAEGKKREVRRMFEAVGLRVVRLRRVRLGPLRLGQLAPGTYRPLTRSEIQALTAATSG